LPEDEADILLNRLKAAGVNGFEIGIVKTASDRKIELLNKRKHK